MLTKDLTVRRKGHYQYEAAIWYAVQSLVQLSVQMLVQKKMATMQTALQKWFAEMKNGTEANKLTDAELRADVRAVNGAENLQKTC